MRYTIILILVVILGVTSCQQPSKNVFKSNWNAPEKRTWIGPEYWTNPLQDWQVEKGRLSCTVAGVNRSIHLLTYSLDTLTGNFETSVNVGISPAILESGAAGWAGFIIGAWGEFNDYRDAAVYGKGINAGITTDGILYIGKIPDRNPTDANTELKKLLAGDGLALNLLAEPLNEGQYNLTLTALKAKTRDKIFQVASKIPGSKLYGNLALSSHMSDGQNIIRDKPGFWFEKWKISGIKLSYHPEHSFGPILFTLYSLSKKVMKLTAQMAPLTSGDAKTADLELLSPENSWKKVANATIDPMAGTATFRHENWDDTKDTPYRVCFSWSPDGSNPKTYYYVGTVKKDPADKDEIVVAAFTGNNDLGFPNTEVTDHVMKHKPDLLVYTGDQIYEPRGGFGNTIEPVDKATLDYLRKWYMFGWEYGDMLRNIPSVCLPDDHDVYHGNIWGCGGKAAKRAADVKEWQDDGGYKMPPEWVNMVQRTQTSHMPDPYDPTPALQNISVYYCDMHVGGISFAIIEDRKWKSAPKALLPAKLKVVNGWTESSRLVDPKILDITADLLGARQVKFLNEWVGDWSDKTIMKSVISQTLFCTVATLPDSAQSDVVVSKLRITKKDEYPPNDIPTQDMDSDGWPKKGRDEAIRVMRKAFAFHICGDQHLATTVQYGLDAWRDSPYAICVPSISNYFPRRWFPKVPGLHRKPGDPPNVGDFTDGFGNKVTVLAVANPVYTGLNPARLYDRSAGYGIVKFNKKTREIEIANWPRQNNPSLPGAKPYDGWPVRILQFDNYSREAVAWLPNLEITGTDLPPVIKITDEANGELVYAVRSNSNSFRPKVFVKGTYTIEAGEPGTPKWKVMKGIASVAANNKQTIKIDL